MYIWYFYTSSLLHEIFFLWLHNFLHIIGTLTLKKIDVINLISGAYDSIFWFKQKTV